MFKFGLILHSGFIVSVKIFIIDYTHNARIKNNEATISIVNIKSNLVNYIYKKERVLTFGIFIINWGNMWYLDMVWYIYLAVSHKISVCILSELFCCK